jgi:hypothetical protein
MLTKPAAAWRQQRLHVAIILVLLQGTDDAALTRYLKHVVNKTPALVESLPPLLLLDADQQSRLERALIAAKILNQLDNADDVLLRECLQQIQASSGDRKLSGAVQRARAALAADAVKIQRLGNVFNRIPPQ